jgi:predicted RNA-binding protein (virulence factor B family)
LAITIQKTEAFGVSRSSLQQLFQHDAIAFTPSTARFMSSLDESLPKFQRGDSVMIEVISFGPLGASVQVVGLSHSPDALVPEDDEPLGRGLVLQKEIYYFRQARHGVDVVKGEVLPAYVEQVRDNGRLDISLRAPGGRAKADDVAKVILQRLVESNGGILHVGDKSTPQDVANEFPGVSKGAFKKAVSALYKKGLVQPSADSITLLNKSAQE